jgi:hypothetical protein
MEKAVEVIATKEKEGDSFLIIKLENQRLDEIERQLEKGTKGFLILDDGRSITADQRKKIYATIADIAKHTGMFPEEAKQVMKFYYSISREVDEISFAHGKMSIDMASDFIDFLLEFALGHEIPLSDLGINRADNVAKYMFLCLKYQVCAVCGKKGELHHVDAIGMGNDRTKIDDSNMKKVELCRKCHNKAHSMGWDEFTKLHHLGDGILFNQIRDRMNKKKLKDYRNTFDYIEKAWGRE